MVVASRAAPANDKVVVWRVFLPLTCRASAQRFHVIGVDASRA
jgi:hypothetical protein